MTQSGRDRVLRALDRTDFSRARSSGGNGLGLLIVRLAGLRTRRVRSPSPSAPGRASFKVTCRRIADVAAQVTRRSSHRRSPPDPWPVPRRGDWGRVVVDVGEPEVGEVVGRHVHVQCGTSSSAMITPARSAPRPAHGLCRSSCETSMTRPNIEARCLAIVNFFARNDERVACVLRGDR